MFNGNGDWKRTKIALTILVVILVIGLIAFYT